MRLNVHIPDPLHTTFKTRFPDVNVSAIVQGALAALLDCRHDQLACAACATAVDRHELADRALSSFYADTLGDLHTLVTRGGTAEGAARIVRDVAHRHSISAAFRLPLPRPTRAERVANKVTPIPTEAGSRDRHPTARRTA